METRPSNIHDSAGKNRAFLPATQRKMLIVTKFLQLKHECLPHQGATRNGAVARPSGNNSARCAGIDELLWHGRAFLTCPKFRGLFLRRSFCYRRTTQDKLAIESKEEELQRKTAEVWPGREHIH